MVRNRLVLCTTVYGGNLQDPTRGAVNAVRLQLALSGAQAAQARGVPLVVVVGDDGEQGANLVKEFTRLGALAVPEIRHEDSPRSGMFHSRQQALRAALELDPFLGWWIEPEKVQAFMEPACWDTLNYGMYRMQEGHCTALTPVCREMNGYPEYQRLSEQEADGEIAAYAGVLAYDSYRGPFGGSPDILGLMLNYDGERYGDRHTTTCLLHQLRALSAGYDVGLLRFRHFRYPLVQSAVEAQNPAIDAIRSTQRGLVDHIRHYIDDESQAGRWPAKGKFVQL